MTTLVTDAQIAAETGCDHPEACIDTVNICECGAFVCTRHTPDVIDCVDIGAHHKSCQRDCGECAAACAYDHACGEAS